MYGVARRRGIVETESDLRGYLIMFGGMPENPQRLGALVADSLVIREDRGAKEANPFYYERVRPFVDAVEELVRSCPSVALRESVARLHQVPASLDAYQAVCTAVATELANATSHIGPVCDAAWRAMSRSRIGYWIGDRYGVHRDISVAHLAGSDHDAQHGRVAAPDGRFGGILVVIPFRDNSPDGTRSRNLFACLRALRDQSLDRRHYRICVVESDERPRWRVPISSLADEYVFAAKSGPFNKSWAVNVGVRQSAGEFPLVCVLDADALVDRDFLARNSARFERPGTGGFLPFRDLTYLDADASNHAIETRCFDGADRVDPSRLRGFVVHRSPGVCVWLRHEVFDAVNGMDERFEDWGGEDMAFVMRLHLATPFLHFDDPMYHLYHRSSSHLVDGQTVNAHISWLDWKPDQPIGSIDRFVQPQWTSTGETAGVGTGLSVPVPG
jgi:hypothetical protein